MRLIGFTSTKDIQIRANLQRPLLNSKNQRSSQTSILRDSTPRKCSINRKVNLKKDIKIKEICRDQRNIKANTIKAAIILVDKMRVMKIVLMKTSMSVLKKAMNTAAKSSRKKKRTPMLVTSMEIL